MMKYNNVIPINEETTSNEDEKSQTSSKNKLELSSKSLQNS